jgi:D-aminopeptidase
VLPLLFLIALSAIVTGSITEKSASAGQSRPTKENDADGPVISDEMSPLFLAVIEATEEAIYNSLFRATTTTGCGHTVAALPIERTIEILRKHGALGH